MRDGAIRRPDTMLAGDLIRGYQATRYEAIRRPDTWLSGDLIRGYQAT
ncbi:MAG: hypothetical protein LBD91_05020 [Prevotellaceae bacterium]|nr:hypothetical protein [Prevotellaceae bacterium]